MKFFILGLVLLVAGIQLLDVNFYLGMAVIGIGGITASGFMGQAMSSIFNKIPTKK